MGYVIDSDQLEVILDLAKNAITGALVEDGLIAEEVAQQWNAAHTIQHTLNEVGVTEDLGDFEVAVVLATVKVHHHDPTGMDT